MGKKKGATKEEAAKEAVPVKKQTQAKDPKASQEKAAPKKPAEPKPKAKQAPPVNDGFEVVVNKKQVEAAKKQEKAAQQQQQESDLVTREYPLQKDQVRPALAKKVQVEDDSNAKVVHKEAPVPGALSRLVLTGTSIAVMRAEAALLKILKEVKHEEPIPTSKYGDPMVGVIIGPKGQTLEKIRELAPNAKVQLPEEGGRYVAIYGQPADVQKIAAGIRQLSGSTVDPSQVELTKEEVEVVRKVPKDRNGKPMHWILIGKGGCNAKRIREEAGAELIVPPPHSTSDEYKLRGSLEAVDRATAIVFELLSDVEESPDKSTLEAALEAFKSGGAAPSGPPRDPLVVPSATGARTCVAPRLQRKFGEQPQQPSAAAPAAKPAAAQLPKKPLESVELGAPTLLDMPLPPNGHSNKVKQRIKEIATENSCKLTFDGNNSLRLDGFQLRCQYAERAILNLLGMTKAEVPIPRSRQGDPMIGVVIGPKGATIAKMRAAVPNAFILLPDDGCGFASDCVTIFGSPTDVDWAIDVVRSEVRVTEETRRTATNVLDPSVMEVEVEVPCDRQGNPLLSVLIGTGGKNIKWIREESDGVEIDVPKKKEQGVVTKCKLRGTDAQIRAAQNCIRILFDDSDQVYGGPVDHVLPPNPYANCIVIGGH
eukprot:EG_transcript_4431